MSIFASCEPKFLYCDQNHLKLGNRKGHCHQGRIILMCNTTILALFIQISQSMHGVFNHAVQHSQTVELSIPTIKQLYWSSWRFSALLNETTTVAIRYGRGTNLPHPSFPTEQESVGLKYPLTFQLLPLYFTYLFFVILVLAF